MRHRANRPSDGADLLLDVFLQGDVGRATRDRASFPPAANRARVPACMVRFYGRPKRRTFREDGRADGD